MGPKEGMSVGNKVWDEEQATALGLPINILEGYVMTVPIQYTQVKEVI